MFGPVLVTMPFADEDDGRLGAKGPELRNQVRHQGGGAGRQTSHPDDAVGPAGVLTRIDDRVFQVADQAQEDRQELAA